MSKFKAGDRVCLHLGSKKEEFGTLLRQTYRNEEWWVQFDTSVESYKVHEDTSCPLSSIEHSYTFIKECISVFEWVEANPGCHSANIRSEILRLLNQHRENKKG